MVDKIKMLTRKELSVAYIALYHAEADADCWEADGDPAAEELRRGVDVIRRLIRAHTPAPSSKEVSGG